MKKIYEIMPSIKDYKKDSYFLGKKISEMDKDELVYLVDYKDSQLTKERNIKISYMASIIELFIYGKIKLN